MNKNKLSMLAVLFAFTLTITACTTNSESEVNKNTEQADLSGNIIENVDDLKLNLVEEVVLVIKGSEKKYEDSIQINLGDTAYDVLKKSSDINRLGLVTKDYDFGKSIDGIGDDLAGTDNKYWLYYINGEMAIQSADKQEVKSSDRIEFKFEESTF